MPHKNETQFFIKHFGREKAEDTKAELGWDDFAKENHFESVKPRPVDVKDPYESTSWTFRPDRFLPAHGIYIFIDGPHHWTERFRKKDDWEDRLLVAQTGKRTFRIDSPLVEDKRYWPDVLNVLNAFIATPSKRSYRFYA
jgi:hypothetical protein